MSAPVLPTKLDRASAEAAARHAHNHALAEELRARRTGTPAGLRDAG